VKYHSRLSRLEDKSATDDNTGVGVFFAVSDGAGNFVLGVNADGSKRIVTRAELDTIEDTGQIVYEVVGVVRGADGKIKEA